jgi:hypothetical protein
MTDDCSESISSGRAIKLHGVSDLAIPPLRLTPLTHREVIVDCSLHQFPVLIMLATIDQVFRLHHRWYELYELPFSTGIPFRMTSINYFRWRSTTNLSLNDPYTHILSQTTGFTDLCIIIGRKYRPHGMSRD